MRNFFGTLFMNDISDRVNHILSTNIPIYLEGKPFLNAISDWFDKILDKAVLYKKNKQEDKYQKLLITIKEVANKLNEVINEDSILREYQTTVQFNIFEVRNNEQDPLTLKLYFNVITKACYYPTAQGMNLFTYINERVLKDWITADDQDTINTNKENKRAILFTIKDIVVNIVYKFISYKLTKKNNELEIFRNFPKIQS